MGLKPVVAPLFTLRPMDWEPPDPAGFDAVLMTSANAARLAGAGLHRFVHVPCHAVGEASADAAADAGFHDVRTGPHDGMAAVAAAIRAGHKRLFHPSGRERTSLNVPGVVIQAVAVYASDAVATLPGRACEAITAGAVVLVHSPRAGNVLDGLSRDAGVSRGQAVLAAISRSAAQAAGIGWWAIEAASRPRDDALLELAAELCQTGPA